MPEEYKRTLCVACPFEADCTHLREGVHCHTCTEGLVCGSKGLLARHDCEYVKKLWAALPRKCILVGSLLRTASWKWGLQETPAVLCPRCGVGGLHIDRHRNFMPLFERKKGNALVTKYRLICSVCGIDEQVER